MNAEKDLYSHSPLKTAIYLHYNCNRGWAGYNSPSAELRIWPEYLKIGLKNIKYAKKCHELDNVNNINVKATLNSQRDISNVSSFDFWGESENS